MTPRLLWLDEREIVERLCVLSGASLRGLSVQEKTSLFDYGDKLRRALAERQVG